MATSPDIWMPIYIGDYLADTMHLSLEEHGAYMMTIMHYWKQGGAIPKAHIKNILRCSDVTLHVTLSFFIERDGLLYHKRIDEELVKATINRDKNKNKTKAATEARLAKGKNKDVTTDVTTDVTLTPSPSPSPSPLSPPSTSQTPKEGVLEGLKRNRKYDVNLHLNDTGRAYAKLNAPDWDMYYLIGVYNEGIAGGKRPPPDNANAAFPVWCKNYTKGKSP